MNILVTGSKGQLGSSVYEASKTEKDKYFFTDIEELDITDKWAVENFVDNNQIDIIVNCAAYTNVDKAEDDYDMAEKLNSEAVKILADAIAKRDGVLIHVSTDYVFGGSAGNTPRSEEEPVNPTGVYGLTKLHGEEALEKSGVRYLIFRTAWLYSEYGKNFVKTMLSLSESKPELNVVFDQCGTPTYAADLAKAIVNIISERKFEGNEGVYHFSNEGVCSWYDFAKISIEEGGNKNCRVCPCHSNEFPSKVVRPSYSVLDKTKFKRTFGMEIPYWMDSLRVCLSNLKRISNG